MQGLFSRLLGRRKTNTGRSGAWEELLDTLLELGAGWENQCQVEAFILELLESILHRNSPRVFIRVSAAIG